MYSRNSNTGKVYLNNVEVISSTEEWDNYVVWLSLDNSPTETDKLTINEINLQEKQNRRNTRDSLLQLGFVIPNRDNSYWFNEATLNSFVNNLTLAKELSEPHIMWKSVEGGWIVIPIEEGYIISRDARTALQQIYINN